MNFSKTKAILGAHNLNLDEWSSIKASISKIVKVIHWNDLKIWITYLNFKLKKHPKFDSINYYHYDIALIKLSLRLQFSPEISPICLSSQSFDFESAIVTGRKNNFYRLAYKLLIY